MLPNNIKKIGKCSIIFLAGFLFLFLFIIIYFYLFIWFFIFFYVSYFQKLTYAIMLGHMQKVNHF